MMIVELIKHHLAFGDSTFLRGTTYRLPLWWLLHMLSIQHPMQVPQGISHQVFFLRPFSRTATMRFQSGRR